MLNMVVFPEPFGPISPAMMPRSTSIVQPLSACTPPKALQMRSVRSSAVIARSRFSGLFRSAGRPRRLDGFYVWRGLPVAGQNPHEAAARLPLEDEVLGLDVLAGRLAGHVPAPRGRPLDGVHLRAAAVQETDDLGLAEAHALDRVRDDLARRVRLGDVPADGGDVAVLGDVLLHHYVAQCVLGAAGPGGR